MNRRLFLAPVVLLPALLFGCAAPPPPPPELDLTITAGADQNPDTGGQAAPVKIFLYQLASGAKFERADVFALTERDKATLGEDMLASEAVVVAPGESRVVKKQLKVGTQVLGVVVLFRDIDHATWRLMAKVAASGPTKLTLTTKGIVAALAAH
ncbi:MAG: type VI secretion system-associated lipoprotein [Rhodospirillales bacterium 70-18]|nr:MAG: type VI secretion system-associated lipoprotein [Rhodospirillales bacterium 70-18]